MNRLERDLELVEGGSPLAAPPDLGGEYGGERLEQALRDAVKASELPVERIAWDCTEFPCIATLAGRFSMAQRRALARALPEPYVDAHVADVSRGSARLLRMAIYPHEYHLIVRNRVSMRLGEFPTHTGDQ